MVKKYVLDTNIILQSPRAMTEGFDDNIVVITGTTLQELDKKKTMGGEVGYNARECCRILDELRGQGDIRQGIRLPNNGMLMVEPDGVKQSYLPEGFSIQVPDNRIISTCLYLLEKSEENIPLATATILECDESPKVPVILVTNDISMRINATVCGVHVEGYRNDQIEESGYTGHAIEEVDSGIIDMLYQDKKIAAKEEAEYYHNQFVTLKDGQKSALTVFRNNALHLIPQQSIYGGFTPKNAMQSYAMWALQAPAEEIPLVIMSGAAGTSKTFLALAAGLSQTYRGMKNSDGLYDRIIISRPSAGGFSEMGFLPGDMKQKLDPLLSPYYDNMKVLLAGNGSCKEDPDQVRMHMDDLFERGLIEILALSFVRGRSLMDTYLICDEAQNSSKSMIRDVITRAGRGTKVVVCGDPNQIDQPTLDKRNNGLVYAIETMKGSSLAAIIQFDPENSVRSELAKEAVKRMK